MYRWRLRDTFWVWLHVNVGTHGAYLRWLVNLTSCTPSFSSFSSLELSWLLLSLSKTFLRLLLFLRNSDYLGIESNNPLTAFEKMISIPPFVLAWSNHSSPSKSFQSPSQKFCCHNWKDINVVQLLCLIFWRRHCRKILRFWNVGKLILWVGGLILFFCYHCGIY